MCWVKRGKNLESLGHLKLCIASRRHSCMIAGYVLACVYRVWVLQTMSGSDHHEGSEERTAKEPKTGQRHCSMCFQCV